MHHFVTGCVQTCAYFSCKMVHCGIWERYIMDIVGYLRQVYCCNDLVGIMLVIWAIYNETWWRRQMEIFSTLLALCAGISSVIGDFPAQRPVTLSFAVCIDPRLNGWVINRDTGDLRRQSAHFDVTVMTKLPIISDFCYCVSGYLGAAHSRFENKITKYLLETVSINHATIVLCYLTMLPWQLAINCLALPISNQIQISRGGYVF